jgi:hypothetical protein
MRNSPDKFTELMEDMPYRTSSPWARALNRGNHFELIDTIAIKQQSKLMKNALAKQLILEGLFESSQRAEAKGTNNNFFDSIKDTSYTQVAQPLVNEGPTKILMSNTQYDLAKQYAEAYAQKKTIKMNTKGRR